MSSCHSSDTATFQMIDRVESGTGGTVTVDENATIGDDVIIVAKAVNIKGKISKSIPNNHKIFTLFVTLHFFSY